MTNNVINVDVKLLGSAQAAEIQKALIESTPAPDGSKSIKLNFESCSGDIQHAISLLEDLHKSDTECLAECSGVNDLASVILIAGCKFGERKADLSSLFLLYSDAKNAGKKRKTLTAEEKNTLEILGVLSGGRKSRIKAFMLNGQKATASEMKSLNLIDEVTGGFVDKYASARLAAKKSK